ncbi:ABC transporter substrate-binding protein [Chelatococcus reniformis]|uniref:ABC transporter substrate-binding protein n=1 Tax=Chelatococcus reniformis TaxID=1494448 RepID=A0A916UPM0_9HYPH|nr:ABC transporter substrate-binding protein [Chelatococcus reniformis]GGC82153.1 ABC transporter substrate-binding protein [Chelatococcus reniformis]
MNIQARRLGAAALVAVGTAGAAVAEPTFKGEIRIGQTLPYSGPLSGFGIIGQAEAAYFKMLNDKGGINGRKIVFISLDDHYSPPKTVEQTRKLVEQENVALVFGSLGTATNNAVHRYLNGKKVPQLFILSGASKWADPESYPWTMPGMAIYASEGAIYAKYILDTKPDAKIAILSQNDDLGRDYLAGFKRGLGSRADSLIVAQATYESTDPTINSQLAALKASGADVVFGITVGKFTTQFIKGLADLGWKPDMVFVPTSASSLTFLKPAGLDNAVGLLSASAQKDVNEKQWADDQGIKDFQTFMKDYMPGADITNSNYAAGYLYASMLAEVLKACGEDLSSANIMRQAAAMKDVSLPLLLPGVLIATGPDDYLPFQQMQLRRFDGTNWVGQGGLLDDK